MKYLNGKILLILSFMIMANISTNGQVKIIAHRGASYLAPENTVASAKLAWEENADATECDIWLSGDNRIIVCHDETTARTTGENYKISETDSKVLRTLEAGSFKDEKFKGEKLPFLEEIIETVPPGKELVVEIKCKSEVLPFLKSIVDNYSGKCNFSFICFDFETISETKRTFPEYPCYWLCSNPLIMNKYLTKVKDANLEGISLYFALINKKLMKKAENLDLEVYSWTVDDVKAAKRLISLGVSGITSNRPGWLRKEISEYL